VVVPFGLALTRLISFHISYYYTKKKMQLQLPMLNVFILCVAVLVIFQLKKLVLSDTAVYSILFFVNVVLFAFLLNTIYWNKFKKTIISNRDL
jgi:hypothetical protein